MPNLTHQPGFRHSLASALIVLHEAGIADSRIYIELDGPGKPPGWVLRQEPNSGEPLLDNTEITLGISGNRLFDLLPFGMREGEGTKQTLAPFDHALARARLWREAQGLLDIGPTRYDACKRWL